MALSISTTGRWTELDAVNRIIVSGGYTPVESLSVTQTTVTLAKQLLAQSLRALCSEPWQFNTLIDLELTTDANEEITIPADYITVRFKRSDDPRRLLIVRNGKVFNRKLNTTALGEVGKVYKVLVHQLLTWDEIPEVAKHWIIARASRKFGESVQASRMRGRFAAIDEEQARAKLVDEQGIAEDLSSYDFNEVYNVILGHEYADALG